MTGRHPSGGPWQPDIARMTARISQVVEASGGEWPELAAAALAARGTAGAEAGPWAGLFGLSEAALDAIERGEVPGDQVPLRLLETILVPAQHCDP